MQIMSDLIALAGQQATAPNVNPGDKSELILTIERIAAAISVSGVPKPVQEQLAPAANLKAGVSDAQIKAAVDQVLPALRTLPNLAALKDPPKMMGSKPAPPPASAPTTGPVAVPGAGNSSAVGNPNATILTPPAPTAAPPPTPASRPTAPRTAPTPPAGSSNPPAARNPTGAHPPTNPPGPTQHPPTRTPPARTPAAGGYRH
jgi:hypothetical protein